MMKVQAVWITGNILEIQTMIPAGKPGKIRMEIPAKLERRTPVRRVLQRFLMG